MGNKCSLHRSSRKEALPEGTEERVDPQSSHLGTNPTPTPPLCTVCTRIDLGAMLSDEVNPKPMGPLSDYTNSECPFCSLISTAMDLAWGGHDKPRSPTPDIISILCSILEPTPQLFIQSRSAISARRQEPDGKSHSDHPQPRLLIAIDHKPPRDYQQHNNRGYIREVDRVKNRHVIAEIENFLPDDTNSRPLLPRRDVGTVINIPLVKNWISECQTKHKHSLSNANSHEKQNAHLFHPTHPFRLIDVHDECLIETSTPCAYVALSYVWGRVRTILSPLTSNETPILLTTRENIQRLSSPHSLSSSSSSISDSKGGKAKIPDTIVDAIQLTRSLGHRYLWVDTLSIIQNDPEDKAHHIRLMDSVYDNASLTIVAASGRDANAGLPGVHPGSRSGRLIRTTKMVLPLSNSGGDNRKTVNLSLSLPSLTEEIRSSTWNTRGWTFQEQCLSPRCLYITSEEVFFNCSQCQFREGYNYNEKKSEEEEISIQIRTGPAWWNPKLRRDLDATPYHYLGNTSMELEIQAYQGAVQDYSRKSLTFASDILNAFEGVYNRFAGNLSHCGSTGDERPIMSIQQTQGVPPHLAPQALLWLPSDGSTPRLCPPVQHPGGGLTEEVQFSSWSWASQMGPIEFIFTDNTFLSRNIAYAPLKHIPLHTAITRFHFSNDDSPSGNQRKVYSRDIWDLDGDLAQNDGDPKVSMSKFYLRDRVGIDIDAVLSYSLLSPPAPSYPNTSPSDITFYAPYLSPEAFDISTPSTSTSRICHLKLLSSTAHPKGGEFRYDRLPVVERVTALVPIVVTDTITKTPDTVSIFLGLAASTSTAGEGYTRVGIGYLYHDQDPNTLKPKWQCGWFRVR
ncbi:HET-domain-containing protein [Zalerion maritima]|uniref:HET-domain-containing protein n=1 Tax=Zalerion maritima TaxID=339359 RepID=A0AAD5WRH2_9PEZI|nr:HET-domain-containing protein [Zalerion maritima]